MIVFFSEEIGEWYIECFGECGCCVYVCVIDVLFVLVDVDVFVVFVF